MTVDEYAETFARQQICPAAPGFEPRTVYEVNAVRALKMRLIQFWHSARQLDLDVR